MTPDQLTAACPPAETPLRQVLDAQIEQPHEWPCSAVDYHRDDRIGRTGLGIFRESPKRYKAMFIDHTIEWKETDAQRLGTLTHLATLEPDRFESELVVQPHFDRRYKVQKQAAAEWEAENAGKTWADPDELALAKAMREAIFSNETARKLLEAEGPIEHTMVWQDHETFLGCKARRDKVCLGMECLVDLKTCSSASEEAFARACLRYGYHRQNHFYGEPERILSGNPWRFFFVAVCSDPPHECAVYELEEDFHALGRAQNRKALNDLATAIELDQWTAPRETGVTKLAMPRWGKYADEYSA